MWLDNPSDAIFLDEEPMITREKTCDVQEYASSMADEIIQRLWICIWVIDTWIWTAFKAADYGCCGKKIKCLREHAPIRGYGRKGNKLTLFVGERLATLCDHTWFSGQWISGSQDGILDGILSF